MTNPDNLITVASVNWHSYEYLAMLFGNLRQKAAANENLKFLIVDNTNGIDSNLEKLKIDFPNIEIIKNNPGNVKPSPAHASGLNVIMKNIKTEYTLIVDPDVHVFKQNWDKFLIDLLNHNDIFAAGISFPPWQLGMYHNFPNPVFCFFKTENFKNFSPCWSAYDVSKLVFYWDMLKRAFLRLGICINRRLYEDSSFIKNTWSHLEKLIGVCSRDTGWRIAKKASQTKTKTILFSPKIIPSQNFKENNPASVLAKYFELYCYNSEQILTHKYSTNSKVFKTEKSGDSQLWLDCIKKIEKGK